MGLITRVRDIVNSNINAVLDKAEDPEKLVRLMIREMEDTLVEIKAACAGVMASRKKAERELNSLERCVAHWDSRAQLAVERNRDQLAREALRAKHRYTQEIEVVHNELDQLDALVNEYKSDIIQVEEKLQTAREKQRTLVHRHERAVQRQRVEREFRRLDTSDAFARFEQFEDRLDRAEAEADLINFGRPQPQSLEDSFRQMEKDESIENELQELKRRRAQHTPVAVG